MWNDLGEYISNYISKLYAEKSNSKKNSKKKVIEIGIGKFFTVSDYLEKINFIDLLKIDINPSKDDIEYDDIISPKLELYENTKIIYSIRPPSELHPYLEKIANDIGAILIIVPLFNEDINTYNKMKLVNYKKAVFYISLLPSSFSYSSN
jgi:uncharacterized UPF0146 family protein